jgi:spermidine synthase
MAGKPDGPRVRVGTDDGQRALLVEGVVQSVAVAGPTFRGPGYWPAMVPDVRPRRALLLGLGAGTVAQLIVRRFGAVPMIGVEADLEVLSFARSDFDLHLPSLTVVEADAFEYVAACDERFDYIAVDLYRGAQLQGTALARPFLRALRALLLPGGQVYVNLFQDGRTAKRLHRLRQVFPLATVEIVGKNAVVRCPGR